jgi:ADP-ribose pyrophosphatase YjhB (NUDIX family)
VFEKVLKKAVICFPVDPLSRSSVWLARKTRYIGVGLYNGYGGGVENGETPLESAVRELEEESGIVEMKSLFEKMAVIDFHNTKSDGHFFVCRCHVFLVNTFQKPMATEEMSNPKLFLTEQLPFENMMPADKFWLPHIFKGRKFLAEAHYGPCQETLIGEVKITFVDELPER